MISNISFMLLPSGRGLFFIFFLVFRYNVSISLSSDVLVLVPIKLKTCYLLPQTLESCFVPLDSRVVTNNRIFFALHEMNSSRLITSPLAKNTLKLLGMTSIIQSKVFGCDSSLFPLLPFRIYHLHSSHCLTFQAIFTSHSNPSSLFSSPHFFLPEQTDFSLPILRA